MKVLFVGGAYKNGTACSELVTAIGAARLGLDVCFLGAEDDLSVYNIKNIKSVDSVYNYRLAYFTGDYVCNTLDGYVMAEKISRLIKENGGETVFDPGGVTADTRDSANAFAKIADYFLPGLADAEILCGLSAPEKIAEHYLAQGVKKVVVKLGKRGAYYKSHVESGYTPTFRADEVVDETGAGDGFAAGLISGICEEIPLSEACVRANAVGSIQLHTEGAIDGLPDMATLREFMLDHRFKVELQ